MPSEPLQSTDTITPGMILIVSKFVQPRGKDPYWWKSFRVATDVSSWGVDTIVLRMAIDEDKDHTRITIPSEGQVVVSLAEHEIPQGVSAMLVKGITLGKIKIVPF